MSSPNSFKAILIHFLVALAMCPEYHDCLIITSVLAGDKKFKTISFHHKWLKPLTFEKEMPLTEFRRHRTLRPPKFDIDINIPIKLPLEEEYSKEEYKKPVESDLFFQTTEIKEPAYSKTNSYPKDLSYAGSDPVKGQMVANLDRINTNQLNINNKHPALQQLALQSPQYYHQPEQQQQQQVDSRILARSDGEFQQTEASGAYPMSTGGYQNRPKYNNYQQEFVPGGFVNLQLSGPTGGPKMTYEDYDREKWAQQLSQAPGAMPYPILNYQQLQNFYGGLGTFTNGLPENRYESHSLLDKLKASVGSLTSKFHLGR